MLKATVLIAAATLLALTGCQKTSCTKEETTPTTQPSDAVNMAVLVGINDYPSSKLNGCVNDIKNVKKFLINKGYFKENEIVVLLDASATREQIINAIREMVDKVTPGGRAYFHYSGHGTQIPTYDSSEIDGFYEAICPVDFTFSPTGEAVNAIIDKEFVEIFANFKKGVVFNWCSDSCFSGDLDRMVRPTVTILNRSYPIPPVIADKLRIARIEGPKIKLRLLIDGKLDVGYISGCRSDQTSADTSFLGESQGAFTHYLLETLGEKPSGSISSITKIVCDKLRKNGFEQRPQAEGTRTNKAYLAQ